MSILEYSNRYYRRDFQTFFRAYNKDMEWHLASEQSERPPTELFICDCSVKLVEQAMASGLADRRSFAINLATEAMLFAGVHSYDRRNYENYVKKVKVAFMFGAHGREGVRHPQLLLLGAGSWGARNASAIRTGVRDLLVEWASVYDSRFRSEKGTEVVRRLGKDPDLRSNVCDWLPGPAMAQWIAGLGEAARAVAP